MSLIERPNLAIADEELLAAQAIARTTGVLSVEIIDSYMTTFGELRKLVAVGSIQPVCPELTNANPSAPHTVVLEAQAWMLAQMAYRINQIPEQNLIEFARLFNVELRPATQAQTIIRFTTLQADNAVTIPAGTRVSTEDESIVFETIVDLTISPTATMGDVAARNLIAGHTLLTSSKLTKILDNIAFVGAATNQFAIDSGTESESIDSALERMRQYQRRGERIVSTKDLEEAILNEALNGNGVVRAFPFVAAGDFAGEPKPGYTTVIVMAETGEQIDSIAARKIALLLEESVGNQFISIVSPIFVDFEIEADVRLDSNSNQGAIVKAIIQNLRNFYSPSREQFGRDIYRSEIIAVIEGTPGVDRIESSASQILSSPLLDTKLADYQLPMLANITINVV